MSSLFNSAQLVKQLSLPDGDFAISHEKIINRNIAESANTLRTGNQNWFTTSRSLGHLSGIDWTKVLQATNATAVAKTAKQINLDFLQASKTRTEKLKNEIQQRVKSAPNPDAANKAVDDLIDAYQHESDKATEQLRTDVHTFINDQSSGANRNAATNLWVEGWSYVQSFIGSVGSWLSAIWSQIRDFFKGIWNGLVSAWNTIKNAFSSAWNAIKSIF